MNGKQKLMSYIMVSAALVLLAVTAVTASSWRLSHTPLHTVRMEQASSEMNFLPTAMNNFAYTSERGYGLNYDVAGYCNSAVPLDTGGAPTCEVSCDPCLNTECNTCWSTCVSTCSTCVSTCSNTCVSTCRTCVYTCPYTCAATC